jgi:shikimate kinase
MSPRAVLVGLPGAGKSTIGRRLAKALGVSLLDTDAAIEERTGRSIGEIFAADGEAEFRRIEERVIRAALDSHDGVLSLGGGAVTTPGVRDALAGHIVVYLEISTAEGVRRTGGSVVRPLLAGPDRAEKYRVLAAQRTPLYRAMATVRVNTNRRNPGAVVRQIVARLENPGQNAPPGSWTRPSPAADAGAHAPGTPGAATPRRVTPATLAARRAGVRK